MKEQSEFRVDTETELLHFLLERYSGKSRNYVKGLLKRGQILIDGEPCRDYSRTLLPGQMVGMLARAASERGGMTLPVIYEDDDIIVIDKPAGMLSISTDRERENTAYHIVTDYIKSRNKAGRVFIVHRLDRETSGVMLLAKSEKIKLKLQESWTESVARRGYIAVVEGKVEEPKRQITSWLRQTKTLLVYSSDRKGDGKMAVTNYEAIKIADKYSLLDVSLDTGRKNQIRVHMQDIGHPVAGDKKYGARTDPFGRVSLHASELVVRHPSTGEEMSFKAPMPAVFKKVL